jgi:hypothetical protein
MYDASGTPKLALRCPTTGDHDTVHSCNVTSNASVSTRATWRPPVRSDKLPPQLLASEDRDLHSGAPSSQHCNDRSLTYPDWVVMDVSLNEPSDLRFSVKSLATEEQINCNSSGQASLTTSAKSILMVCKTRSIGHDQIKSSSSFQVAFDNTEDIVSIQQSWNCSDSTSNYTYVNRSSTDLSSTNRHSY